MAVCQYCLKVLTPNTKFCTGCGRPVGDNLVKCVKCGNPLKPGLKFCTRCGEPAPKTCPHCNAAVKALAKFCTSCGKSLPVDSFVDANICSKCGTRLKPGSKFCVGCGTAVEQTPVAPVAEQANSTDLLQKQAEAQAAEQARIAEVQRKQAEALAAEQARLVEEKRKLDEAKAAAEAQTAEQARIAAERKMTAEEQSKTLEDQSSVQSDAENKTTAKKLPMRPIVLGVVGVGVVAGGIVTAVTLLGGHKTELDTYFQDKYTYGKIVDARDQQEYRTIKIGNQEWLAQNMNYDVPNSVCDSCDLYGRYYTYAQAANACPEGFKVPTVTDFIALQQYDAAQLKAIKGWNADNSGSDEVGFVSIPAGFVSFKERTVKRRGETSGFWTSLGDGYNAVRMKIEKNGAAGAVNALDVRYGFPVRCISSATSRISEEDNVLLDGRTGELLKTITIGSQKWLAKNSAIKLSKSYCYDDDPENCDLYGRLYEWSSAHNACPVGTRLPNAADIAELKGNPYAITKLNLVFGGFRNAKGSYELKGDRADMWTVSEANGNAKYWFAATDVESLNENKFSKKAAMSVRCIVGELENDVRIGHFVDNRDNQEYAVVTIGKQTWMAQNLNFALPESYCYNDDMDNCNKYGRLYVYSDAKESCPENYHLPSDAEWRTLKNYLADHGNGKLATMLKSSSDWTNPGKDLYGLNVLPSGYRSEEGEYDRLGERAYFWSVTTSASYDSATRWAVIDGSESFYKSSVYMQNARAVRCIRDQAISINAEPEHRSMSDRVDEIVEEPSNQEVRSSENYQQNSGSYDNSSYRTAEKIAKEAVNQAYKEYDKAVRDLDDDSRRALNRATKQAVEEANRAIHNASQDYNRAVRDVNRMMKSAGF